MNEILIVLLEYSPIQSRVIVRGVWQTEQYTPVVPLHPDNIQNSVQVFLNFDMRSGSGFTGLVAKEREDHGEYED